jgi:uncharacterized Fe-S cluster protein YjdI
MAENIKEYSNGEITIVWKPDTCIHSAVCFRGLPQVFDPRERPWIKQHNEDTQSIIHQINQCPSKALSFYYNEKEK